MTSYWSWLRSHLSWSSLTTVICCLLPRIYFLGQQLQSYQMSYNTYLVSSLHTLEGKPHAGRDFLSILLFHPFHSVLNPQRTTVCVRALSHTRVCDSLGCGPPGPSVRGILQAGIMEWMAWLPFPPPGSPQPRDQIHISLVFCMGRQILAHCPP